MAKKTQTASLEFGTYESGSLMPQVGKDYIVKDGNDIWVGRCVDVQFPILFLEHCSWIANTGYWADFLRDGYARNNETEYSGQRPVAVTARTWQEWPHDLITVNRGRERDE